MKAGITDEIKGKGHQLKGAVKETAGKLTNNRTLEAEGRHERVAGKVQKKVGQVERVLEK